MIEESSEQSSQTNEPASTGSADDMAAALADMKGSSPSMSSAIDAAGITPDKLAESHDRATENDHDPAQATTEEGSQG
ncbi:MAG: hypothetical protein M3228_09620 [Actinomycetota bacterium]|nr:hypothetical protein [Actinomycetota bacterium]